MNAYCVHMRRHYRLFGGLARVAVNHRKYIESVEISWDFSHFIGSPNCFMEKSQFRWMIYARPALTGMRPKCREWKKVHIKRIIIFTIIYSRTVSRCLLFCTRRNKNERHGKHHWRGQSKANDNDDAHLISVIRCMIPWTSVTTWTAENEKSATKWMASEDAIKRNNNGANRKQPQIGGRNETQPCAAAAAHKNAHNTILSWTRRWLQDILLS